MLRQLAQNIFTGWCLPTLAAITGVPVAKNDVLDNVFLMIFQFAAFRQIVRLNGNHFMNFDLFGRLFLFFVLLLFEAVSSRYGLMLGLGFCTFNLAISSLKN